MCIVYDKSRWPFRRLVEEKYQQKGANLQGSRAELIERVAEADASDIAKHVAAARSGADSGKQKAGGD